MATQWDEIAALVQKELEDAGYPRLERTDLAMLRNPARWEGMLEGIEASTGVDLGVARITLASMHGEAPVAAPTLPVRQRPREPRAPAPGKPRRRGRAAEDEELVAFKVRSLNALFVALEGVGDHKMRLLFDKEALAVPTVQNNGQPWPVGDPHQEFEAIGYKWMWRHGYYHVKRMSTILAALEARAMAVYHRPINLRQVRNVLDLRHASGSSDQDEES